MDLDSLKKLLDKAMKEEGVQEAEQPLFIDEDDKVIKCHWCKDQFKGLADILLF